MAQDFEKAKAYLKKSDKNGETVYDHITKVLLKIAKDKPEDCLSSFENISKAVKAANLKPSNFPELPSSTYEKPNPVLAAVDKTLGLYDSPYCSTGDLAVAAAAWDKMNIKNEDEEEDEDAPKVTMNDLLPSSLKCATVPDLMRNAELLNMAGYGLPEEETYRLSLSMRRLATTSNSMESIRFFGKIFGTVKDYYVCEAKMLDIEKEAIDRVTKKEEAGKGANEFTYFVANSPESEWTRLPDVLPEQIITARQMRRFFTGDLRAPVKGSVRFPWPEASLLRAQIARISAAAVVSPKGFYTVEEGDEEEGIPDKMLEDPEYEAPGVEELLEAENWCHHRAHLLKQGRTKPYQEPEAEEDEEEEEPAEEEEEEEEEEPIPLLQGLEADEGKLKPGLWRFGTTPKGTQHCVSTAISLQWPGAVSVAQKKKFATVYIGYGQKMLPELYAPPPPPAINTEYVSGFNPEEAEEDETDPTLEQADPLPPKESDEGDEGEDDE